MAAIAQPAHRRTMMEATRPSLMEGSIPGLAEVFAVGDRITVGNAQYKGTVRFFGETSFAAGNWAGVALDEAHGKNDGSVKGFRYFECESAYGLFVRPTALTLLRPDGPTSRTLGDFIDEGSSSRQTPAEETMRVRPRVRMSEVIEEVPSLEALMSWKRSDVNEKKNVQAHSVHDGSDEEPASSSSSSKRRTSLEQVDNLDWSAVGSGSSPSPGPSTRAHSSSTGVEEEPISPGNGRQVRRSRTAPSTSNREARIRSDVIQQELAEAVEDHDVDALRRLIPLASNLGLPSNELESAQNMLNFEVQQKALDEVEDVRSAVQKLTQAVHKAELRAAVVEEAGRNGGQPKFLKGDSQSVDDNGEAWIAQVGNRLEERVWSSLEKRLEDAITAAVRRATEQLVQVAGEIRGIRTPTNGNSERRSSRTRPGELEEDVRMRPGEISPGRSADNRVRAGSQARERMQQKRRSVKEARSLEMEQISFAMRRNAYQRVASPCADEEIDEFDVVMQKMEVARAAAKDRLVGASTRIQAAERGRKARQSIRLNQACDPKKISACQTIQLFVRKWQASRHNGEKITDFAAAAFAARRRHGAWAHIFDMHLQRGGASNKFPLGLTEASFSLALKDAYPFVSTAQASALWQGYTDGTDKEGVDLKGYCYIAEAVGLGPDAAAEFADLSKEAFVALGQAGGDAAAVRIQALYRGNIARRSVLEAQLARGVDRQVPNIQHSDSDSELPMVSCATYSMDEPEQQKMEDFVLQHVSSAQRLQRAWRTMRARRKLTCRSSIASAACLASLRHKAWVSVFNDAMRAEESTEAITKASSFQEAILQIHPRLSRSQVSALWEGFRSGTDKDGVGLSDFCSLAEAVAIGDNAACEYADMDEASFMRLGVDANGNSSSQSSRQSSAARVLQRAERKRRARRQASGCADLDMSAVVQLTRKRYSAWAEVFDMMSDDRGSLNEESLCRAIREIHPDVSRAQVNAMWRGFLECTDRSSVNLKTFCSMLEAIASGDEAAAQFADMLTEDFAALAKR